MTDEQAASLRLDYLATQAKYDGLDDPPVVALVRWTDLNDWGFAMTDCLQDAGFNAHGGGGELTFPGGVGPAQRTALDLAYYVCDAKYTKHPKYTQPMTAEQLGLWYDYQVEWLVPCLATLDVTVSRPPTRQTYVTQYLQNTVSWSPIGEADWVFAGSWKKEVLMFETCPEYPPAQFLWGE